MEGFDRWSGSMHKVDVKPDGAHVFVSVEATSGANAGETLLTPAQARAMAAKLTEAAVTAEHDSGWE